MKKRTRYYVFAMLFMGLFIVFANSCKKDDDDDDNNDIQLSIPELSTYEVIDITDTSAISGGNILKDGGAKIKECGVCWSKNENPTINDNITEEGADKESFLSDLTGLEQNTTYYVRAYATNKEGTGYGNQLTFTTIEGNILVDPRDGKVYKTVDIGNQKWMAENLAYLPEITFEDDWGSLTEPQYAVYGYAPGSGTETVADAKATENYKTYGVMYNWSASMNQAASSATNPSGVQGVCPAGWHLPSDAEWTELTDYLGGLSDAGSKLKETGTTHWKSQNTDATNETGFTGLPGGYRTSNGDFAVNGFYGNWGSSTESGDYRWYRIMRYDSAAVERRNCKKDVAISVRCVKD